jgi:hypothetical protein
VPGQADALVGELRNFFAHRQVVGSVLLLTMFFFSALALRFWRTPCRSFSSIA